MANEVRVLVTADTKKAHGDIDRFSNSVGGGLAGAAKLGMAAVAGLGLAAAGGLAVSVNAAAKFEHAVDQIGAVANATSEEMKGLSDAALRIGKDTAFSATEAAMAMEILAANGVSVADIMNGAADATVALAAAGGTDLKMAADVASTSMAVWGLKATDMTDVVNRLAGAANVSRFGVEDMAGAVAMGGGAAKSAGVEFGDFATAIAAMAPSFSSGSDAGTSFKTFLQGLTPDTKKAKEAFAELGLSAKDGSNRFFDASGNLKSMADITDILHNATVGLNEEQKSQALTTIFGTDAMRAAAAISQLTGEEFRKMDETMKNTDAAEVAAARMGNFKGSMEALKGSIEVIQIQIGTKLLPVLTRLADFAAVNLPIAFAYIESEVAPRVRAAFEDIRASVENFVTEARPHMEAFAAEAQVQFAKFQEYYDSDLKPAFDNIVTAVEYLVEQVEVNWDKIGPIVEGVALFVKSQIELVGNVLQVLIDLIGGDFTGAWENAKQAIGNILEGYSVLGDILLHIGTLIMEGLLEGLNEGGKAVWEWLQDLGPATLRYVGDVDNLLWGAGKAIAGSLLAGLIDGAKAVFDEVASWGGKIKDLKGPIEKDRLLLQDEGRAIARGLADALTAGLAEDVLPNIAMWGPKLAEVIKSKGSLTTEAIADMMRDIGQAINSVPLTVAARRKATEMLDGFVYGIENGKGVSSKSLQSFLDGLLEDTEEGFTNLRVTTGPKVQDWLATVAQKISDAKPDTEAQLQSMITGLDNILKSAPMNEAGREMVDGIIEGFRSQIEAGGGLAIADLEAFIAAILAKASDGAAKVAAAAKGMSPTVDKDGNWIGGKPPWADQSTAPSPNVPKGAYGADLEWDPLAQAWVQQGTAGSTGTPAERSNAMHPGGNGIAPIGGGTRGGNQPIIFNVETLNAATPAEARMAAGDLAFAMRAAGVA